MFDELRSLYALRRKISRLKQIETVSAREELRASEKQLEGLEYKRLLTKATKLGVDIPTHEEKSTWWESNSRGGFDFGPATVYWLSDAGMAGVSKLIREERRKNVEWWVRTVGSVAGLLTGLLGALIGVIAFLKK
jgi:hypothetical protein